MEEKWNVYNLFVKHFNEKTLTLKFRSPIISGETLISYLDNLIQIPCHHNFFLVSESRVVSAQTQLTADQNNIFPTVCVTGRLPGGKGGFGSLLRGAATKAGQKKTNNFDACRDMSGRRLRHVNAEKKLEEWREEEEERKLERMAEEYLKKKANKGRDYVKGESAEKYVEKYREESEKCKAEVEVAVREAVGRERKRKGKANKVLDGKRLKIWLGKSKFEESDDDMEEENSSDDDDSSKEENGKSSVINNGSLEDSRKEVQGSPSSVSGGKFEGESSGGDPCECGADNESVVLSSGNSESGGSRIECIDYGKRNGLVEPEEVVVQSSAADVEKKDGNECKVDLEEVMIQIPSVSSVKEGKSEECLVGHNEVNGDSSANLGIEEEKATANTTVHPDKLLDFNEYNSAAEMEVLGMDRLKSELQTRGIKCGGTLQERAARLFMLKTTPLDKLPKKLLAKK